MAEKEKEWVLIIEQANVSMKLALKNGVVDTLEKEVIKASVRQIIEKAKADLKAKEAPIDLITKFENSMKLRFVEWYKYVTLELMRQGFKNRNPLLLKSYEAITGEKLKNSKGLNVNMEGYEVGSIPDVRKYMTTGRTAGAQSFMPDYVNTVKKAMQAIAEKNLVMKDRLGRKLSLRNLAEMTARFQNTQERLQTLKDEGVEYVVASTHSNASERCQIWQGKVFIIDCEIGAFFKQTVDLKYQPKPLGKIDGINYYSLKDAMLHGFLGYNCRHRLVKYMKGMDLFNQYDANTITKERQLEERQRYLERKIRKAKEKAMLSVDPNERRIHIQESKYYQEVYTNFCQVKGLTIYEWRTRISRVERLIKSSENGIIKEEFVPAINIKEAEEYLASNIANDISFKGVTNLENINIVNKTLTELTEEFQIERLQCVKVTNRLGTNTHARANGVALEINAKYLNDPGPPLDWQARIERHKRQIEKLKGFMEHDPSMIDKGRYSQALKTLEEEMKYKRWSVSSSSNNSLSLTISHEYGHILSDQYFGLINRQLLCKSYRETSNIRQIVRDTYLKAKDNGDIYSISMYASTDECEFFAECFAAYRNEEKLPDYINQMLRRALKNEAM